MDEVMTKGVDEKFCSECGAVIKAKAEICPKCGVRQMGRPVGAQLSESLSSTAPNGKSKIAAGLFAIFLGGLGAHKFYLGQIGWGIVYLVLFWTFIPALIGFIEGILLLTMSEEAFNKKYGQI
jgi:TM2 domain-containing membrane protein YozV/ribosomal protein L40E